MIFPENGLSYREAAALWNVPLKDAIRTLNELIVRSHLVNGGTRNGHPFWVKEKPEILLDDAIEYQPKQVEKECELCGKRFITLYVKKLTCSAQCAERRRTKVRTDNHKVSERRKSGAYLRRKSAFDKTELKKLEVAENNVP